MAFINWSKDFETGFSMVDNQHKKLIGIANRLHDARVAGKGLEIILSILNEFVNYTKEHFENELRLLERQGSKTAATHQQEHEQLLKAIGENVPEVKDSDLKTAMKVMNQLREWLMGHIIITDVPAFAQVKDGWNQAA